LQEFRTSLQRGGLLAADRGHSPLTPSSAISEWGGPFSQRNPNPLSATLTPSSPMPTPDKQGVFSPGPSSAPSAFAWPLKDVPPPPPGQRARAISAVKPGSAYVNTSGRVVPVVPVLKVVEPEASLSTGKKAQDQSPESESTTPTQQIQSPRAEEFAMTPLQPSPEVSSDDKFGLMSPTSTEFSTSPFDRSALLAQLGMGSITPDEGPRRSVSLKSRSKPKDEANGSLTTYPQRRLRGKISSPSIREQKQLQDMQARIEASLPNRSAQAPTMDGIDEALMSPRATEFTQNPFALALAVPSEQPSGQEEAPRTTDSDPRSPAQKGVSPITRNIMDVL
jgi:tyrosine-protein phosphatase MSG5